MVGKLQPMHLAVPGELAHLYHTQSALAQGGEDRAWILSKFIQEIDDWKTLIAQTVARSTHLDEIFCREPIHLGFCKASGIGAGGVSLDTSRSVSSIVWRHPCPTDIIMVLISDKDPGRTLTNSDLNISALILHKATLLDVCPEANMATPCSGSDNIPTVSCSTRESSTINLLVA